MKWLYVLPLVAIGWTPAAAGDASPAPDYSEYVYLHVTRGAGIAPARSCRGSVQTVRS